MQICRCWADFFGVAAAGTAILISVRTDRQFQKPLASRLSQSFAPYVISGCPKIFPYLPVPGSSAGFGPRTRDSPPSQLLEARGRRNRGDLSQLAWLFIYRQLSGSYSETTRPAPKPRGGENLENSVSTSHNLREQAPHAAPSMRISGSKKLAKLGRRPLSFNLRAPAHESPAKRAGRNAQSWTWQQILCLISLQIECRETNHK
ncbi:hypothetical protein B0J12DRAFT_234626 [Macrophomina phaseolina]|uniref:Uncharacterized protein n=1 Tax=Macrophomina phaseolina TaxID=35725 RepID=A0ABQ8GSU9_9PEZI|nr:hypothetical protein B0J12DRAFT_234626 [Macrophomina phaseolina]